MVFGLTWWVTFYNRMAVHLQGGVPATACKAHYMVLAIIDNDGRLVDADVVCSHVEDDANLSFILE